MPEQDGSELAATRPQQGPDAGRPAPELAVGAMLGQRYRLESQLGAGSTGAVYKANDLAFDRTVAVKVMRHGEGDGTALFLREARITAQLDHPNIVPIYDLVWLTGGGIAFAMKHIHGITLREALQQAAEGATPRCLATVNDLITVFLKVCDGLTLAHARGVIHRDIKPDNIVIGQYGEVLVLDWGEASSGERPADQSSAVGTPLYMSPEQARGEVATPGSDVYCLAASMFHCLLRRPPLAARGLEPEEFWERKRRGTLDPPTAAERATCDRRLLAVLEKALAAEPAARYATVRALADDLAAFQAGQAVSAYRETWLERALRWHRRNARTVWLSLLLLATGLALAAVLWGSHLQRLASWGSPVLRERFADGWEERWRPGAAGQFAVAGGHALSLREDEEGTLLLRQEWPPHCAIEFTGEVLPDAPAQDISVFWLEGPEVLSGPWDRVPAGWKFQFGAWDNTASVLAQVQRGVVACSQTVQIPGRRHRIRAEVDGDRRRLLVDGATVFDHQDSFGASAGRWMIYLWGRGKQVSDVAVYLRGSAEVVSALDVPDALRRNGLGRAAALEYRRIAASQAGRPLADQALLKEGLTLGEIDDWAGAELAWRGIADPSLRAEADILALTPLIQRDPRRLFAEIASRWPAAPPAARRALVQMWIAAGRMFEQAERNVDGELAEGYFGLRQQLFPEATDADWMTFRVALRTGRHRLAVALLRNRSLRGQLLDLLGEWQRVVAEGTPNQAAHAAQRLAQAPGPLVEQAAAAGPCPDWLARAAAGERAGLRRELAAADRQSEVVLFDRLFGDPGQTLGQPPTDGARFIATWLAAIEGGDAPAMTRWERECLHRDADRRASGEWRPLLLEPIAIYAGLGRTTEARDMAVRLRAVPRHHFAGVATAWGEALAGAAVPVLPEIVHPGDLLAALRADLAGQQTEAAGHYRTWYERSLPSYASTGPSLLRLARWRAGQR